MKKFALGLMLLVLGIGLFSIIPVKAQETITYTCYASGWTKRCDIPFYTHRNGLVSVNVSWIPTSKGKYSLDVYQVDTAEQWCSYYSDWSNQPPPGNWTCTFINGLAGNWHIYFNPYRGGQVFAIITIIAETNP